MGILVVILGLGWLVYQLIKDASIKPVPPNTDYRKAVSDMHSNNLSGKESDRRIKREIYIRDYICFTIVC